MSDTPQTTTTVKTPKNSKRAIEVTVVVNLNGAPVPTGAASVVPPAVVAPDPVPPAPLLAPDSTPAATPMISTPPGPPLPWYSPKHLLKILDWMGLELAETAVHFYKSVSFWFFTVVGALPDIYNMAVSSHYITADKIPANVTNIVNMIAFFGAAMHIVAQKKPASTN